MDNGLAQRTMGAVKAGMKRVLPSEYYRRVRASALDIQALVQRGAGRTRLALSRDFHAQYSCEVKFVDGMDWKVDSRQMPHSVSKETFDLVISALDAAGATWWFVGVDNYQAATIAVNELDRDIVRNALAGIESGMPLYAQAWSSNAVLHAKTLASHKIWDSESVVVVFSPARVENSTLTYGAERGCHIEFWQFGDGTETGKVTAPRENRAARLLSASDVDLVEIHNQFGAVRTPVVLTETMVDDLTFPIDAVYTWVDGDDPAWIKSKRRREAELTGSEYHEEAKHEARFRSRDELKYSLRSLEMYAPWFRKIFVVTAGQVPEWLDVTNPKIEIIDHRDIYPEGDYLPTFNSNSIISRLHHIPGLSEHYVYINDDVFFGRDLGPERFFTPTGIAKVSPSNNRRPFGEATLSDEPHFNLTRNIRRLLKERFGLTVSRAIKHTPHPQLKSVHQQMEREFKDEYERTWSSPFRDHRDVVADQLHHYYAQIIGKAIPTRLRYHYINILDDRYRLVMENTLRLRDRDTFCINDAPVEGAVPIDDGFVDNFLESYFPVKSGFEK